MNSKTNDRHREPSPNELEPVFHTMLENATRVCEANFGILFSLHDGVMRAIGSFGVPHALNEFFAQGSFRPAEDAPIMRVARSKQPVHVIDFTTESAYVARTPVGVAVVELGGARTVLVVPMLRDEESVGAFAIFRQEVRPFTEKQIDLANDFAAQAVIAMEKSEFAQHHE